ncbi:hypothetical protein QFZ75_000398 [Streptomyces sp. V3I8]|nr:hypothetical protein [Streptomyces sp. V3I8]
MKYGLRHHRDRADQDRPALPAGSQAAPPAVKAPAAMAHQGTADPDIMMCPREASSTQTAAKTAALSAREHPPSSHGGIILAVRSHASRGGTELLPVPNSSHVL